MEIRATVILNASDEKSTSKEKETAELLKDQISTLISRLKSGVVIIQSRNTTKKSVIRAIKMLEIIIEAKIIFPTT